MCHKRSPAGCEARGLRGLPTPLGSPFFPVYFDQREYKVRCEWGTEGLARLAPQSDAVVIVDVFSFCTAVDIAVGNGAIIYPYATHDESAEAYARSVDAVLAARRLDSSGYSLSPSSLVNIPPETRLVIPSRNGSALSVEAGQRQSPKTLAGCLRNARAVAGAAEKSGGRIAVIPAGERWPDGSLRFALEDWIAAGAIIRHLSATRSPEAQAAQAAFERFQGSIADTLRQCGSGKELLDHGLERDLELASALDVSECVPVLRDGAYVRWGK